MSSESRAILLTDAQNTADDLPPPPPVVRRPLLARWLFDRDLRHEDLAKILSTSRQAVSFWCLPFGHPQRTSPSRRRKREIAAFTRGGVPPETFDVPAGEPEA